MNPRFFWGEITNSLTTFKDNAPNKFQMAAGRECVFSYCCSLMLYFVELSHFRCYSKTSCISVGVVEQNITLVGL